MNQNAAPIASLPDVAFRIIERIQKAKRPLITAHIRLDGDALGSELGLAHILRTLGQEPHVVNDSKVPLIYQFLPGIGQVGETPDAVRGDYDLAILLDTPTWARAKNIRQRLKSDVPVVTIDHHPRVEPIGELEWTDTSRCAAGEMVYELAIAAKWPISAEAATNLYVALMTDTGRFTFPNTTSRALRAAAALVDLGAEHVLAAERVYADNRFADVALRAEALSTLKTYAGGKIAIMRVTHDMMARHGVDPIDTQELADFPRAISGVAVGVLLREMKDEGKIKVSLRSRRGVNIEPVARHFGGGGHPEASGAEAPGDMDTIQEQVLSELTRLLLTQNS